MYHTVHTIFENYKMKIIIEKSLINVHNLIKVRLGTTKLINVIAESSSACNFPPNTFKTSGSDGMLTHLSDSVLKGLNTHIPTSFSQLYLTKIHNY